MRRLTIKLVLATLAMLLPLAASAAPASADPLADQFLAKINALRASKGVGPVRPDAELTAFAQSWSDHMASVDVLSHNPALADSPGSWTKAGENVGVGPDLNALFDAFVASPHHYANLVDPSFNLIGIGVSVTAGGNIYTTHDFEARSSTPARAPTPPTTAPTTPPTTAAPKPVAPAPVPAVAAAAAAPPAADPATAVPVAAVAPAPVPAPEAPLRIRVSLDQSRGADAV